ncbi:MAG TPA: tetraacyldisaccharide 4'-kinase, partial [Chitinophagales bacterium]|nr:tetraacyldisaccharide 4'-kinase [Chitinophagales bacterium]
ISIIYGSIIGFRNWLYKTQFIGSTSFSIPIISIGNLNVGGSGKTPFVELLIELLHPQYKLGVLSRGYKRKTSGFLMVQQQHTASIVGDEPLMVKLKYPSTIVAVGEERVMAIPRLMQLAPQTQLILLDDAFQHQSVRPDINILLTTFDKPFFEDSILPLGTLREHISGKKRANIIIVSKCPEQFSMDAQNEFIRKIQPHAQQRVFFTTQIYGAAYHLFLMNEKVPLHKSEEYLLVTGIAKASYLKEYILSQVHNIIHYEYDDHHPFEIQELESMHQNYPYLKTWLTTEKDAVRLAPFRDWFAQQQIAIYCIPVQTQFIGNTANIFEKTIKGYLDFYYQDEIKNENEQIQSDTNKPNDD